MANNQLFNIEVSINEIREILEAKAVMKNINISVKFDSFFGKYIVNTDMKRM